jgi:hypothetical protein
MESRENVLISDVVEEINEDVTQEFKRKVRECLGKIHLAQIAIKQQENIIVEAKEQLKKLTLESVSRELLGV